jgi:hypothetical protein
MKKQFILIIFLLIASAKFTLSQVAVNNTGASPDGSAMLDVNSESKGILIPRVTLNSVTDNLTPVNIPANGLLVFNQGGNVAQGFYFWSGQKWSNLTSIETVENIVNGSNESSAFGEVYEYNTIGAYSSISIPSAGSYGSWTTGSQGDINGISYSTSGFIIESPGMYSVSFTATTQVPVGGKIMEAALFVNGIAQNDFHSRIWFKEGSKSQNISLSGLISLSADDVVTVGFTLNESGSVRVEIANFSVTQVN